MTTALFISITVPILILVVNIIYQNSRDSKNNYDKRIDSKLDKDEYNKDMKAVNARLKKNEDVISILVELKEGQAQLNTNVEWLKDGFSHLECKNK